MTVLQESIVVVGIGIIIKRLIRIMEKIREDILEENNYE